MIALTPYLSHPLARRNVSIPAPPHILSPRLAIATPNVSGSSPGYSPSLGSSPNATEVGNPSLYRILNDVLPLNECEVYSWYPEPEYDPHVDPEENEEASEYDDEEDSETMDIDNMDIDIDGEGAYASWGQAGMEIELDDIPETSVLKTTRSASLSSASDYGDLIFSPSSVSDVPRGRNVGGLLWSANYFFYSK